MKFLQKTYFVLSAVLLYTGSSFAAFNDYIVSALDEVNIQLDKVATLQDDYSSVAQEYTQGKLGEMGDLQSSVKQAKKVQQAQKNLEKLQKMQKDLQDGIAAAQKLKDDTLAQVQEMQALKDEAYGAIKDAKDAYSQQIKAAQDLAQQSYEKANAQFEAVSAQAADVQKKIDEERGLLPEDDDNQDADTALREEESSRTAFAPIYSSDITPLPIAGEAVQYNLPQGISEDGEFLQTAPVASEMTMLPAVSAFSERTGLIEGAALNAVLPDAQMLQQLPDASQLLEAPAEDVLQQSLTEEKDSSEQAPEEKSDLSLEEQLLAVDEETEPKMSDEEFKALLEAKDEAKKAARPQRDFQAEEEQFQQKLQAKDEAKRASLGLTSSRRSFGTAKIKAKLEGGDHE